METIINTVLHTAVFLLLLLMYFRMYTSDVQPQNKWVLISWYILKIVFVALVGSHAWLFMATVSDKVEVPGALRFASWAGLIVSLCWTGVLHGWNHLRELKKEIKHIKIPHKVKG